MKRVKRPTENDEVLIVPKKAKTETKVPELKAGLTDEYNPRFVSWVVSDRGKKQYQQDKTTLVQDLMEGRNSPLESKISFFAVYDGHGGEFSSEYLRDHLHDNMAQSLIANHDGKRSIEDVCRKSFLESFRSTDTSLMRAEGYNKDGSCAVVVLIVDDLVWVAFAGDCRAVLGRSKTNKKKKKTVLKGIQLTKDHSPLLLSERKRIEKCGGRVEDGRVNGILGVSRSFGDIKVKKAGVISQPDVTKFTRKIQDRFLILACDGLWGVFSCQEASSFVFNELCAAWQHELDNPVLETKVVARTAREPPLKTVVRKATQKLIREAVLVRGSKDNTTAIVVLLDHPDNLLKLKAEIDAGAS